MRMRSVLVEFHRFNDLDSGSWSTGAPYLVAAAAHRVRQSHMPIGQDDFLDLLFDLRYSGNAASRLEALRRVGGIATQFLGNACLDDLTTGTFPVQLDLVVNPAELAALPFEAATDSAGQPLFARSERAVVVTRRVRCDFAETSPQWPVRPRILYAWASPPGVGEVPSQEHENALCTALEPWLDPKCIGDTISDRDAVLTILRDVSLPALEEACLQAIRDKKPYTHVHLLAHGYPIADRPHRQRFGMALCSPSGDLAEVAPEQLELALKPLVGHAVVVTLATCDSANLANTTTSRRSIVHNLHVLGFPIVVGSQLPLTKAGSSLMVATFYGALLAGNDVRQALHDTRVTLYKNQQVAGHDWASLVGYAQLPEGYRHHLLDVRLESLLAALKTIQRRVDRLVSAGDGDPGHFDGVAKQVQARISTLESFLAESEETRRRGVLEEHLGLLGSAEKRLAELYFVRSGLGDTDTWRVEMRKAMGRSRDWYEKGSERNLSDHWPAVQYLSLEAALAGRIGNPDLWHAAVAAAGIDRRDSKGTGAIWALGSLLELYLLAPFAGQSSRMDEARAAWAEMRHAVAALQPPDPFPIESTERQLRRYAGWWTTANGFFPGQSDLAGEAASLLA
jgi:CHAT domain